MKQLDWPALSVLLAVLVCLGFALKLFWRIWPVKKGEVRLSRSTLGGAVCALTYGIFFVAYGLYLQAVRHDTTGIVPIVFATVFLVPSGLVIWRWLAWRLWVEAAGLRQRRWLGKARLFGWTQIARIKGRHRSEAFVVETTDRCKIIVPLKSEGAIWLLDAALRQSIPLVDIERHEKQGWLVLPASKPE